MASRTFLAFLTAYTLSQFYRSFLAVIAPDLARELHMTAADLGQMSAAWFFCFAVAQFPLGSALDGYGPRRVVPVFMAGGVLGALMFSLAQTSLHLVIAMGLIGIGCAPALMGAMYVFAREFPGSHFAFMSSMIIGLGSAGNLLGGSPLAYAAEAFGWRSVMAVFAILTGLSAVLVLTVVKDPPPAHTDANRRSFVQALSEILKIRALWPAWPLMALGYAFLIAERSLWAGPYYSQVFGLNAIERGHHILVMAVGVVIGALAYGPLDQALHRSKHLVFTGSLITAGAFCALSLVMPPRVWMATAALFVVGAVGMTYAVLVGHIRLFFAADIVGRGITFANFLCMAAAGVIQVISGHYVADLVGQGLPAIEVYARLHAMFGVFLVVATLIYAATPSCPAANDRLIDQRTR